MPNRSPVVSYFNTRVDDAVAERERLAIKNRNTWRQRGAAQRRARAAARGASL